MDLPDEITLKLRFTADPTERYGAERVSRVQRLREALKRLRRSYGLVQYKRGSAEPVEVFVCGRCEAVEVRDVL